MDAIETGSPMAFIAIIAIMRAIVLVIGLVAWVAFRRR